LFCRLHLPGAAAPVSFTLADCVVAISGTLTIANFLYFFNNFKWYFIGCFVQISVHCPGAAGGSWNDRSFSQRAKPVCIAVSDTPSGGVYLFGPVL
jgi:hypothetical protein